jgi:AraC-like DNA-binding protein
LRPYFTTFYITEIDVPSGGCVTDHLHPEWANVRFVEGSLPESEIEGSPPMHGVAAIATGPTSTTTRFTIGTARIWGVGLLPLGWARFVGAPAYELADRLFDIATEPAFATFRPLAETLFGDVPDEAAELARIVAHFEAGTRHALHDEARIMACHNAIIDPEIGSVAEMAEAAGLASHTVERICRRYFGFPPRMLLRRQRFMRSLVQYMLDPSLHWITAMDSHYHDQAQFVRDFHRFMGMSPSEYGALPHPVLSGVMIARQQSAGAAVQALHRPGVA